MWGEPELQLAICCGKLHFNSLAPCGANPGSGEGDGIRRLHFNSLAPCGANQCVNQCCPPRRQFQLTRPVWGEPIQSLQQSEQTNISTHSPRVGRTSLRQLQPLTTTNFNSLAPCGANLGSTMYDLKVLNNFNSLAPCGANRQICLTGVRWEEFQLTRPVWGEPQSRDEKALRRVISTHSPRVGRTCLREPVCRTAFHFNSLAPCGANRRLLSGEEIDPSISTHSPRVGRTKLRS